MYRSAAAKRLLSSTKSSKSKSKSWVCLSLYGKSSQHPIVSNRIITPSFHSFGDYHQNQNHRFLSTTQPPTLTDQIPNPNNNNNSTSQQGTQGEGVFGDTNNNNNNASSSTSSQGEGGGGARRTRTNNYQEEQSRVLAASLPHVFKLGWSEAAMIAGARDVSLSPSIVGSIPRKEAALVEYFMDECLQKLIDEIDSGRKLGLQDMVPSERIAKLVKTRLEIQAPYISKWPQALSIQAQPLNFSTSFKQRAMLVDEFCHAASDEGTGVDWYLKRTVLGGIYSSTEIYMLTDNSTDFQDTWTFLNDRVRDAFDLKKTFQEVKYFTEAVGAGVGGSFQGFMKKGC